MKAKKSRILFLIPSLKTGGAERVFSTLLSHSDPEIAEWHLLLIHPRTEEAYSIPPCVTIHTLNRTRVLTSIPSLWCFIWSLRPNIILSTLTHLNLAVLALKSLLPSATKIWIRESNFLSENLKNESSQKWMHWLIPRLYGRAENVLVLNQSMGQDLIDHFNVTRDKIKILPNPCEYCTSDSITQTSHEWGMQNPFACHGDGPHVIVVGRLTKVKQGELAVMSAAKWRKKFPALQLWFIGEGPHQNYLKNLTTELGIAASVHFSGLQKNLQPWYTHANLLLHTSKVEGLPNVLIEAIALACPIQVLKQQGGSEELLRECGLEHRYVSNLDIPMFDKNDMLEASRLCKFKFAPLRIVTQLVDIFSLKKISS